MIILWFDVSSIFLIIYNLFSQTEDGSGTKASVKHYLSDSKYVRIYTDDAEWKTVQMQR